MNIRVCCHSDWLIVRQGFLYFTEWVCDLFTWVHRWTWTVCAGVPSLQLSSQGKVCQHCHIYSCSASLANNGSSCSVSLANNGSSCSVLLANNGSSCSVSLANDDSSGSMNCHSACPIDPLLNQCWLFKSCPLLVFIPNQHLPILVYCIFDLVWW